MQYQSTILFCDIRMRALVANLNNTSTNFFEYFTNISSKTTHGGWKFKNAAFSFY